MLADRWSDMIFGSNIKQIEEPRVIEKNDKYTIQSTVDRFSANQYYELSGGLASGNYVVIRMSVESFRESIAIANKFYLGVGISLILVTTLIIIWITRKYTQPLLQLADISKRMSELDFNVKYEDDRDDEIGVLGESMNEMSDKLETAISELKSANLQLHKDIAKKEEVDEMRKEFISNVSHELKTPIALIQGYAEGLQESISDNPEDMDYYCDVIIDEAGKMNKMVKNLLTLNQLEFGDGSVNMERFDIISVIAGVIHSMQIKANEKQVNIEFNQMEPIYVWADEFQIEEVITNYLSNALNHVDENRITPLLNPLDCLENHTQYICGTCGRCICIEHDPKRGLQRWNFPFKSLEIAKLYLRTDDYSTKKSCGIYELKSENGRLSYKIFADSEDLLLYLKKNKAKTCKDMKPVFMIEEYREYANTQIRKLTSDEIQKYMSER